MSSSDSRKILPNGLPDVQRLITATNADGKAIYHEGIDKEDKWVTMGEAKRANFFLAYSTRTFPVDMNATDAASPPEDIQSYTKDFKNPPGMTIPAGAICRFVDFAPNAEPLMHRTESLDLGVVIEGTMEQELDSGEKKIMHRGDVCVQRGTNHAWRNITENGGWARMMFVLLAAEKVTVGGKDLGENIPVGSGLVGKDD